MATVLLDANFLAILLHENASVPKDPATGVPYSRAQERVEFLVEQLQDGNAKILIPTPALGEFLILAHPDGAKYISELRNTYRSEVADFDEMAAIELAELAVKTAKPSRIKRGDQTWAKLKYDRQIVAIAMAPTAQIIYSTDGDLRKLAESLASREWISCDIPLPPPKQMPLSGSD